MSKRIKVLVVDDDKRMAKTICDILKVKGHETIEANSGEEAIEKMKSDAPDCVLMDIKMGGLNGIETLKIIRLLVPVLPAILLMSAYATEEQISEAKEIGAYEVLNKPLDIKAVLDFLELIRKEKSILIAGKNAEFCGMLKNVLQSKGHKVEIEIDPGSVVGDMEQEYKLLVLLDFQSGNAEVVKTILTKYPEKPVILITDNEANMASSMNKMCPNGAYTCLHNPLEIDALIEQIEKIDRKKFQTFFENSK